MRPFVMSLSEESSYTICVPGWSPALAVTFSERSGVVESVRITMAREYLFALDSIGSIINNPSLNVNM